MSVAVQLEPGGEPVPAVQYRWDPETEILSARLQSSSAGPDDSVEITGPDGSWIVLDVARERLDGVEVAVWPTVHHRSLLVPPEARETVAAHIVQGPPGAVHEISTVVRAESDRAERVIHFRVGTGRPERTVRVGRDLLLDLDTRGRLAGLWLLNVPPSPTTSIDA